MIFPTPGGTTGALVKYMLQRKDDLAYLLEAGAELNTWQEVFSRGSWFCVSADHLSIRADDHVADLHAREQARE